MGAYFGLDLGSSSIKVVQLRAMGARKFGVEAVGLLPNPTGSVDFLDSKVSEKLGPVIKNLLSETGIRDKRAVVAIPEAKVFSRIVQVPNMSDAELASAVKWEAEQFVPVPVSEVEMDYVVVKRPPKGVTSQQMMVYLVAAPKKYLQAMVDFLLSLGIEPIAVESEMIAVSRAHSNRGIAGASLLVHIGALTTVMGIVEGETLFFSYAMENGGAAMTRALSQSLQLPIAQAEEYKRTYGLDEKQLEGKVRSSLLLIVEGIVGEMRKAIEYYATERGSQVTRVVLSGGGAYLPELASHLGSVFGGIEVMVGDPFAGTQALGKKVVIPAEKAVYVVAVGLAQRSF